MFIRMRKEFYKVCLRKIIRNSTDNIDGIIIVCRNVRLYRYVEKIRIIHKE